MSTTREIDAYTQMQARLIALLLRHDERRFHQYIGARTDAPEDEDETLLPYRELATLFHLRDELFEHILPRIVRRLSFESPRSLVAEEPPARGRVHWERSLAATWGERPGAPPLLLQTTQRRRDFATPENLLTVVTLLQYRADIQRLLWGDAAVVGTDALRHPLNDIAERCERALAFPQFSGLRPAGQQILEGEDGGDEALEQRVMERALPGGNSAYEDLLAWRARRRRHLLRRGSTTRMDDVLGADPNQDNYLYQLWIFYELADMLHERGLLERADTRRGRMALSFRWGDDTSARRYELWHDQGVPEPVVRWEASPSSSHPPGVRPDFYLRRTDPPPQRVLQGGRCHWREPGVVWDAKYYRERDTEQTPSPPIKRMLADLTLLGEQEGVLLFAFLQGGAGDQEVRRLAPSLGFEQTIVPDLRVSARQLEPGSAASPSATREILVELLDRAHAQLCSVRTPACHGVFLDTLSARDAGALRDRWGAGLGEDLADILVCPKPHVGAWRVDIVSRGAHCCRDARLCHIAGQPGARPPIRPPRTAEELLRELQRVVAGDDADELDDAGALAIAEHIEQITRRFADVAGATQRISVYEHRLRDLGMERTLGLLAPQARESLALAVFLVEQLDAIHASDYSAPTIHVAGVLESELARRVLACPDLTGAAFPYRRPTLGTLPFMRRNPERTEGEWDRLRGHVDAVWDGHVDPDAPEVPIAFAALVDRLQEVARVRNRAAHTGAVLREQYSQLFRTVCQAGPLRIGALNVLLLAWRIAEP